MFERWVRIEALSAGLLLVCACGGSGKEAKTPSDTPASKDEIPKWEPAARPETSAPKSSGGATAVEAAERRSDQYDKEGTEIVLKRAARQVKEHCGAAKDDSGKAVGPWGKTTIQIQLGHTGRSTGTTIPAPYQGKPTGNCAERAFSNLTFPPWGGADLQLDWEIELIEPGKSK